MKKLVILVLLVLFGLSLAGCAEKTYVSPKLTGDEPAQVTLYAFDASSEKVFGLINLGHAFVTIKNTSDAPLTIGAYTLPQGEEVSIGTWGMNAHWGIWYNVESTYMTIGRYKGRVSLTQGIGTEELGSINTYLLQSDTWTPFKNCSYFAVDLWNLVSDESERLDLGGLITPERVANRIRRTESYKTDRMVDSFGRVGYRDAGTAQLAPFELRTA